MERVMNTNVTELLKAPIEDGLYPSWFYSVKWVNPHGVKLGQYAEFQEEPSKEVRAALREKWLAAGEHITREMADREIEAISAKNKKAP